MPAIFDIETSTVVLRRYVQNDVMVGPWFDYPEVQPPTLTGLLRFMDRNPEWDKDALEQAGWWGPGTCLDYGPGQHVQWWLPGNLTQEDQERLEQRDFVVVSEPRYMGPFDSVEDLFLERLSQPSWGAR